jgi:hypothetical protein
MHRSDAAMEGSGINFAPAGPASLILVPSYEGREILLWSLAISVNPSASITFVGEYTWGPMYLLAGMPLVMAPAEEFPWITSPRGMPLILAVDKKCVLGGGFLFSLD